MVDTPPGVAKNIVYFGSQKWVGFDTGGISHGGHLKIFPPWKSYFLIIRLNEVHNFIIDTQHTISHHSSLSSIPTHPPSATHLIHLPKSPSSLPNCIFCSEEIVFIDPKQNTNSISISYSI
ncbi:hypothetical protein MTR_4g122820 [Medicago truncatula]|uniref:Uncharacterized protein n=1 Tax=Medicago truncatula TaxID=3880 RepID=G7JP08_MEDTR|nr:hypothetical protein MTR_4g122820 [Medicago truncatula]